MTVCALFSVVGSLLPTPACPEEQVLGGTVVLKLVARVVHTEQIVKTRGIALRAIVNAWVFVQVVSPMRQSGKIHSLNPTIFHHAVPDLVTNLESNATLASPTPKFIP
jgi:hypothetical protein